MGVVWIRIFRSAKLIYRIFGITYWLVTRWTQTRRASSLLGELVLFSRRRRRLLVPLGRLCAVKRSAPRFRGACDFPSSATGGGARFDCWDVPGFLEAGLRVSSVWGMVKGCGLGRMQRFCEGSIVANVGLIGHFLNKIPALIASFFQDCVTK